MKPKIPLYLAIQNKRVLGSFDTREEASERINQEISKDRIALLLKKSLLKKFVKKAQAGDLYTDIYIIAEVLESEIPQLF